MRRFPPSPPRATLVVLSLLVAGLATGCASTAKIGQFEAFAAAGKQYDEAMEQLLDQSVAVLVNTNSDRLLQSQEEFQGSVTREALQTQDKADQANLAAVQQLQRQVKLLSNYFDALSNLATTDAATSFASELENTVTEINGLSTTLSGSALIDNPGATQQLAQSVGDLVVRRIQLRALEQELEARKQTIAEVLQLHKVLLEALAAQVGADTTFVNQQAYEKEVVAPLLAGSVSDPATWKADRLRLLSPAPLSTQIQQAQNAIQSLQAAWAKLLSTKLTAADIQSVVDDLQPILAAADALQDGSGGS